MATTKIPIQELLYKAELYASFSDEEIENSSELADDVREVRIALEKLATEIKQTNNLGGK